MITGWPNAIRVKKKNNFGKSVMALDFKYDVAIIGSGLGSLTCASLISQFYDKKVIVIEQSLQIGGYSQTFISKTGVPFEVGVHQIGELHKSSVVNKFFNVVTNSQNTWRKMPEIFSRYYYPGFVLDTYSNKEKQIDYLSSLFPREKDNIVKYYSDISKIAEWYKFFNSKTIEYDKVVLDDLISNDIAKLALITTGEYLTYHIKDQSLRSFLCSNWTDYGLPPSLSSFLIHALIVDSFSNGVYFPEYGSEAFVGAIQNVILQNNGTIRTNSYVKELKVENKKCKSLIVFDKVKKEEEEIHAEYFISGIGVINTYNKLFPKGYADSKIALVNELKNFSSAHVNLFGTLKSSPEIIGADASLPWFFESYDHESMFRDKAELINNRVTQFTVSFPSLKRSNTGKHNFIINSLTDYNVFKNIDIDGWKSISYHDLKQKIGNLLIDKAEAFYPGLTNLIEAWELSTPLTTKKYTNHYNGMINGLPSTPERYKNYPFTCHTPLSNLFLTGVDITSSGIYGALLSGVITVGAILKDKEYIVRILKESKKYN